MDASTSYLHPIYGFHYGEKIEGDIQVPDRPNPYSVWDDGSWSDGPIPVPENVTRYQAMLALEEEGYLARVEDVVANTDATTKLAWANASVFVRRSDFISSIAVAISLGEDQVDDLFRLAATFT